MVTERTVRAGRTSELPEDATAQHPLAWRRGIALFVLASAVLILSRTRADPDLWGHVRFGQLMRRLGAIPETDPYSYLAVDWINHEWLAELVFGLVFDLGGPTGLVLLKVAIGLLVFGVLYACLFSDGLDELRGGLVAVLALVLLTFGTSPVRPQLFTYIFFLGVLLVIRAADEGRRKWLWTLPPLFAVWANFHGGFLAGLGVLLLWSLGTLLAVAVDTKRVASGLRTSAAGWGALLGSAAATLLNPYGVDLLFFVLRTATVPRPEITEWNPVELVSVEGAFYLLFVAVLTWGVLASRRRRPLSLLVILGVTALLPLVAIRHVPLFAVAGTVIGGPHLGSAFRRRRSSSGRSARIEGRIGLAFGAAGLLVGAAAVPNMGCIRMGAPATEPYPQGPVELLSKAGIQGNLATFFNWGEYVIWHLGPEVQVSIDGRRETVYPDSVYQESLRFLHGVGDWDALLEKRPTDLALVPRAYPVFNLLTLKGGWELVHADTLAGLFARTGSERLRAIDEAATVSHASTGRCFP